MKHAGETAKLNERFYRHKTEFKHPDKHDFVLAISLYQLLSQYFHESNCKSTFYKIKIVKKHPFIVPQWPSNFVARIKTKFKDFSREMYKKMKFKESVNFTMGVQAKIMFKKAEIP